jgi:hypothetical protein
MDIVANGRSDAFHLIGRDGRADARAAHHQSAVSLPFGDRRRHLAGDIRKIDRIRIIGPDIDYLMPERLDMIHYRRFQAKTGMIGSDD